MIKPSLHDDGAGWQIGGDLSTWVAGLSVAAATSLNQALEHGAVFESGLLQVPSEVLSRWPETVAIELGLPPNCPLALDVRLSGALGREGARLSARWLQPGKRWRSA